MVQVSRTPGVFDTWQYFLNLSLDTCIFFHCPFGVLDTCDFFQCSNYAKCWTLGIFSLNYAKCWPLKNVFNALTLFGPAKQTLVLNTWTFLTLFCPRTLCVLFTSVYIFQCVTLVYLVTSKPCVIICSNFISGHLCLFFTSILLCVCVQHLCFIFICSNFTSVLDCFFTV